RVRAYDFQSGKELRSCAGQTANAIPTPVSNGDLAIVTSGFRGNALYAFGLDGTGELDGTDNVRWTYNRNTPYVPSPLLAGAWLSVPANNDARLTCLDARTGKPQFESERLEGLFNLYASPVAARDRIYVLDRQGTCAVLRLGPKVELLALNK